MLGGAHARANSAAYEEALQDLREARRLAHQIADRKARDNQEAWIEALQARIHAVTDDEDSAIHLYRHVAALARKTRNLDLQVTALVFGSDLFRSKGLYKQALDKLALVFDDNELYGRPYTRVWGRFYRGETLCAAGQVAAGMADLQICRENAILNGNHQAMAWASLAIASYRRCHDLDAAQQAITDCEVAMVAYGGEMLLCDVRLAWERAELVRARGHAEEALRQIAVLRERLTNPYFPVHLPYMTAHMLALEGEVSRLRGESIAHDHLRHARILYAEGKWQHNVARVDVSLWLLTGHQDPPKALLARCRRRSYAEEIEYLTNPPTGYLPLHSL
jgi:ATP/maltotriose-dependent transcriptional regulator MalT